MKGIGSTGDVGKNKTPEMVNIRVKILSWGFTMHLKETYMTTIIQKIGWECEK